MTRGRFRLDFRPQGLGFFLSPAQIGLHLVAVAEVIGDDCVDVSQVQRVVGADHFFWRHAILVLLDDKVEADTTVSHANGATLRQPKR